MVTMKRYEYHKFAELLPTTADDDYHRIREDIRTNGLMVPIVLYHGQILDGRTRYRACLELRITPRFTTFYGTEQDALRHVASHNFYRRHLDASQKAMVGSELARVFVEEGISETQARKKAAELADSSVESIRKADLIRRNKPERTTDIVNGHATVNEVATEIRAEIDPFSSISHRHSDVCSAANRLYHAVVSEDMDEIATGAELKKLLVACGEIQQRLLDARTIIDRMRAKHFKGDARC